MEINSDLLTRHSEQEFAEQLRIVSDAGSGVVHVRCTEMMRAVMSIRKSLLLDGNMYKEWDVVNGFKEYNSENMFTLNVGGDRMVNLMDAYQQPHNAIVSPVATRNSDTEGSRPLQFFAYVNPHFWMEGNPILTHLTLYYASTLPSTDYRILLVTPDIALPNTLMSDCAYTLRFNPPGLGELRESMDQILKGIEGDEVEIGLTEEERDRICFIGAGMPKDQFDLAIALSSVKAIEAEDDITAQTLVDGVAEGKTDIVNKNDLLELYHPEDMENVGGMDNLKDWVRKRSNCYSDEAREFGIEPPRGLVLCGPPGTGKSITAKAISHVLGVPLIRLDFGRVFNALVGSSEERMRMALRTVEACAPAVCWIDEIDKGLGGIGGSGDSGTSNRVLGTFLTWLQDCKYPVMTVVTLNNVEGLPPELLRRGRFDAIFATGLPDSAQRKVVLEIHLRKRDRSIKDYTAKEIKAFLDASDKYVPAEIEAAVKDGLVNAYNDDAELTMPYLIDALQQMVPLSSAFDTQIKAMTDWARDNATPADHVRVADTEKPQVKKGTRTVRRTRTPNTRLQ